MPEEPGHGAPARRKTCPDCAEDVQSAARVCRYCGYRFEGSERGGDSGSGLSAEQEPEQGERRGPGWKYWLVGAIVVAVAWSAQTAAREEGQPSQREISEDAITNATTLVVEQKLAEANAAVGIADSLGVADGGAACVLSPDEKDVYGCSFEEDLSTGSSPSWTYRVVLDGDCFSGSLEEPPDQGLFTRADTEDKMPYMQEIQGCL